jgi:transcriptional regulator with XRE-family HTH domain
LSEQDLTAYSQVVPRPTIGEALAELRRDAGLSQADIARKRELADKSSVSSIETGNPRASSIVEYLDAVGRTVWDLAEKLEGKSDSHEQKGTPRPEWVASMARRGVDARVLAGIAMTVRDDPRAQADFVESARAAAAEIARAAIAEERDGALPIVDARDQRIADLEAENRQLRVDFNRSQDRLSGALESQAVEASKQLGEGQTTAAAKADKKKA